MIKCIAIFNIFAVQCCCSQESWKTVQSLILISSCATLSNSEQRRCFFHEIDSAYCVTHCCFNIDSDNGRWVPGACWLLFVVDILQGSQPIHPTETIANHPNPAEFHDDVIKWEHFPRYWPLVRGIHRSPVNSPHKGQWRGALMFSLICARIKDWVNNGEAGDLRRYCAHYDVTVV